MTRHDTTVASLAQIEPLLSRLRVTTAQQAIDLDTLGLAVSAALDALRAPTAPPLTGARRTRDLLAAAIHAGKSLAEVAHLSGVDAARLHAVSQGDGPSPSERARLMHVLADWDGRS